MNWIQVKPVIDYSVRDSCVKPYPGHPKGCPGYGKKQGCPPTAPKFDDIYDLDQPVYAIINLFPLGEHIERMREKHPDWSERQLRCCLYWQNTARKSRDKHIDNFLRENPGFSVETCPESMGVDVTATMKMAGIELEWPPENVAYQVALAARGKQILWERKPIEAVNIK